MERLRVMAVFGTRPEAVKMAPVVRELKASAGLIDLQVVVTGQHREMLDQILKAFHVSPDFDLDIMRPGQPLAAITSRCLDGLDPLIESFQPQLILAQGDTTTTFASSLAAFYRRVDFGHIEAGLRSGNRAEPFPEEMNRRMTSLCAALHFAPTEQARERLLAEGVEPGSIWVTGNTVIDALVEIAGRDEPLTDSALDEWMGDRRIILVTAHRRENWGPPMENICRALKEILARAPGTAAVFAMHKNPVVRETILRELSASGSVRLIEPPDYLEFVKLMKRAYIVVTDSGGVQEEAPSLGKPVLVLRNTTERPEGVEAGSARLVGTDQRKVVSEALRLMENVDVYRAMAQARNPYGDGSAARRIRDIILHRYNLKEARTA